MTAPPSSPRASRWEGIGVWLIGLALVAALPLIALSVYRVMSSGAELEADARRETMRMARTVAARLDERVRTADALMVGVALNVLPVDTARAHNDSVLQRVLVSSEGRYGNVVVIDSNGTLVGTAAANARLHMERGAYADRGYFINAQKYRRFVVGEIRRSQVLPDSAWVVVLARALLNGKGEFRGLVSTAVLLDSLIAGVDTLGSVGGTPLITVIDTSGMVLARSLNGKAFVGQRKFEPGFPRDSEGVLTTAGLDSVVRLTSFTQTHAAPWQVNAGVPLAIITAHSRRIELQDLSLVLLAVGLTAWLGFRIGQGITRPIESLADDARAVARGEVSTRTTVTGPREVALLGDAFNQMAETVERRNASLADSERRYRLLFDSNPLPMWAWDAETMRITAVNEAAIEHYGHTRETFLSLRIVDLLDPTEHTRFNAAQIPFAESRHDPGVWMHRTARGDTVEMEVITTSSRRLGRDSWLSVGIDVTARRVAERALAVSEEQLRQSQKMEAIGAFAGGISHDFNNLLTGMLGYCDLALDELDEHSSVHVDVSEIRALAMRGADLTRQILAVSRKQVVRPTLLDANETVRGLDRLLRRLIGEHIQLDTILGEDVGIIFADVGQLEQVLLNLTANARDAMPSGGTLRIETRQVVDASATTFGLSAGKEWVMITVTDTGHGMSEEVQRRVFEPFFTTKERGKGTGLGLALAYAMVDQGGGAIRVESKVNVGTTFRLFFPVALDNVSNARPSETNDTLGDGTETILLAEDEPSVRAVAAAALERRGYRVLTAPDGEAALAMAKAYPEQIDLLLTDAVMPRMNGRELAIRVTELRPTIRVLFASGYTDDASLLHGIRTDELSFLHKPFTAVELVRRVRSVLDEPVRVG